TDSLGWVYYKMGNYKKALKILKKATGIVQDDPVIFEHLGDAYIATGNSAKAKEAWLRALESHEKTGTEEDLPERVEQKIRDLENQ
ncbi:MAG: tetratricopeptide repeat protein, partial [Thermodesulfovibrionales bacterium]|nr:tetratricopeptide repeat protein [Thermodesulfovibrionales bacterium]